MKKATYTKRTQISLSPELKQLIEIKGSILKESLSEYLRKSAILRMVLEDVEKKDLSLIAEAVVGKVRRKESGWKDIKDVSSWQRKIREDEDRHIS